MLQSNFGEVRSDVCGGGDAAHVFDAVDVCDDFAESEIPGIVCDWGEVDCGDGDLVEFDGGWVAVEGEELHVDRVCVVCLVSVFKFYAMSATKKVLTDWYHALIIIIQVLLDNLK